MSNPAGIQRTNAEQNLLKIKSIMAGIPDGGIPVKVATAQFAQAQVIATSAVAQALLDIGDVLREGFTQPRFDVEVD